MHSGAGALAVEAQTGVVIDAVDKSYGPVAALRGITLAVAAGEFVAVVGPSGCGKSTLLELVCGLQRPDAGEVRAPRAVLMPQRDLLLPWYSAIDNAALALRNQGMGRREAREAAGALFERFGLAGFEGARPEELSGGMRQRVAFLRTLVAGKPILALDEPFASLDAISRAEMQEWLAGALRVDSRTVLLVSHDIEEALYLADRVVVLSARPGGIVAEMSAPHPRAEDRDHAVTDPAFVAVRERALMALREGAR